MDLPEIVVPAEMNYIAAFLTFACTLRCTYCINHHGGDLVKGRRMSPEDWIRGLNRLKTRPDLPVTLQGGEPTVYKGFYEVVNGIRNDTPIDLLTNLEVNPQEFASKLDASRLRRDAPYASIRVSYHKDQSNREKLLERVSWLKRQGFHIGIWIVDHPGYQGHTKETVAMAQAMGIDIRTKEFLGPWEGKVYGTMRYPDAVNSSHLRFCDCRTSEILVAPDGCLFRCHSDLYANRASIGHILDPGLRAQDLYHWRTCAVYGKCNSCDIKLKFNRFQQTGHSSVEIESLTSPYTLNKEHVKEVVNTYGKA